MCQNGVRHTPLGYDQLFPPMRQLNLGNENGKRKCADMDLGGNQQLLNFRGKSSIIMDKKMHDLANGHNNNK